MMRGVSILVLGAALAGLGGQEPLAAQGGGGGHTNPRLAAAQPPKFVQGLCPLRPGNKKVEAGISSLKKAHDAKVPADKAALLADAQQNLLSAITLEGQANNGAAWYYLARVALLQGDPAGADSAFTKAEELIPTCELDIGGYRQNSWAALGQAGLDLQKAGQADSALEQFRDASYLFRALPHIYSNMGVIYANSGRADSAAAYFAKALAVAEADTSLTDDRDTAAQNLALMYIRTNQHAEAIKILQKTRGWDSTNLAVKRARLDSLKKTPTTPATAQQIDSLQQQVSELRTRLNDTEKSMAITYRNAGDTASAAALEGQLLAKFSATDLDSLDTGDVLAVGASAFNAGRYGEAERAFSKVAERNAWSRDARYNLSITHLAVSKAARDSADALRKQTPRNQRPPEAVARLDAAAAAGYQKLAVEAGHLLEIDPMNEDALRLLAQALRGLRQDSLAYKTAERLVALPFSMEIMQFQMGSTRANVAAEATGRSPMDADGKALKPAPVTLVFEFLDVKGTVLDTKEVTVPVLTPGQKHSFALEARGNDITGWKYRRKA